jgi:hypothetical protein
MPKQSQQALALERYTNTGFMTVAPSYILAPERFMSFVDVEIALIDAE